MDKSTATATTTTTKFFPMREVNKSESHVYSKVPNFPDDLLCQMDKFTQQDLPLMFNMVKKIRSEESKDPQDQNRILISASQRALVTLLRGIPKLAKAHVSYWVLSFGLLEPESTRLVLSWVLPLELENCSNYDKEVINNYINHFSNDERARK